MSHGDGEAPASWYCHYQHQQILARFRPGSEGGSDTEPDRPEKRPAGDGGKRGTMIRSVGVTIGVLLVLGAWWTILDLLAAPRRPGSSLRRPTRSSYRALAALNGFLVRQLPTASFPTLIGIVATGFPAALGVGLLVLSLLGFAVLAWASGGQQFGIEPFGRFLGGNSGA